MTSEPVQSVSLLPLCSPPPRLIPARSSAPPCCSGAPAVGSALPIRPQTALLQEAGGPQGMCRGSSALFGLVSVPRALTRRHTELPQPLLAPARRQVGLCAPQDGSSSSPLCSEARRGRSSKEHGDEPQLPLSATRNALTAPCCHRGDLGRPAAENRAHWRGRGKELPLSVQI